VDSLLKKDTQARDNKPPTISGFTLAELMITVAIASIVTFMAIPSFTATIKNNRLTTQVNDFVTSLSLARSEAVKRSLRVSLCKSSNASACAAIGDWSQGWIVFTNQNNNSAFDSATETLLKVQGGTQAQVSMAGVTGSVGSIISYGASGKIVTGTGTLKVCDDRAGNFGKNIVFVTTGRSKIVLDVTCP
jgi:type IV fimbrial biogenesis protein FimT